MDISKCATCKKVVKRKQLHEHRLCLIEQNERDPKNPVSKLKGKGALVPEIFKLKI